jgi:hypothetical protein
MWMSSPIYKTSRGEFSSSSASSTKTETQTVETVLVNATAIIINSPNQSINIVLRLWKERSPLYFRRRAKTDSSHKNASLYTPVTNTNDELLKHSHQSSHLSIAINAVLNTGFSKFRIKNKNTGKIILRGAVLDCRKDSHFTTFTWRSHGNRTEVTSNAVTTNAPITDNVDERVKF